MTRNVECTRISGGPPTPSIMWNQSQDTAEALKNADVLAQGVGEQEQHGHAAGDTDPMADLVARLGPAYAAHQPGRES